MPFEKSVLVPLSPGETFALIAEPERLRRWQAVTARVDLRAGGQYRWTIIPGSTACGSYVEVERGKRVVFTWGWEGSDDLPPGWSTVTITLEPTADGTLVHLVHDGLTDEQAASHGEGWSHYLDRLVRAAADGDVGPDDWGSSAEVSDIKAAEAALAICQRVLRGIGESGYDSATVCPDFTVAQLAEHLIGSVTFLGGLAGAQFPDGDASTLEARLAAVAQPALEAWNARGTAGTVKIRSQEAPATVAVGILSIEFLVHAWDFGRASGQQVVVPDALAEHVLGAARTIIEPQARDGVQFGAELEAGPDASSMDRLVAFTGRAA